MSFSLPPVRLLGLLVPDPQGSHEWTVYFGAFVILLGILGVILPGVRKTGSWWIALAVGSLLVSFGSNLPLMPFLSGLPGLSLLRVPSRMMFLFGMALAALASHTLENFGAFAQVKPRRLARLTLTSLVAFVWILAGGIYWITGTIPPGFILGAVAMLVAGVWLALGLQSDKQTSLWITGLFLFTLLDLMIYDSRVFQYRPAAEVLAESQNLAKRLGTLPGEFRVYSPSYSIPQQTAARSGLELADGIDPLQLRSYSDYMQAATGVPPTGYSVTLPAFANGNPRTANQDFMPDPALLGALNVKYIVSAFPINHVDLTLVDHVGDANLYINNRALPRAWVQTDLQTQMFEAVPVKSILWRPNRIEIMADGPGVLVLSEIAYPGWQVFVDGVPQEVLLAADLLRAVRLTAGAHIIRFEFRPVSVWVGSGLGLLGLLALVAIKYFEKLQPGRA